MLYAGGAACSATSNRSSTGALWCGRLRELRPDEQRRIVALYVRVFNQRRPDSLIFARLSGGGDGTVNTNVSPVVLFIFLVLLIRIINFASKGSYFGYAVVADVFIVYAILFCKELEAVDGSFLKAAAEH